MKVITEERLLEKFAALYWGTDNCDQLLEKLLAECKEIGTLEVSKLRPMSDAVGDKDKRYKRYLFKKFNREGLEQGQFDTSGKVWIHGREYFVDELEGFIPMPIYNPEEPTKEMIWPDACG